MAKTEVLQSQYTRMIQDVPRHMLPKGAVWDMVDYIPNLGGAPIAKRGGFSWASPTTNPVLGDAGTVAWAPFVSGDQLIRISGDGSGTLWRVDSPVSETSKGGTALGPGKPIFFNDLLIIPQAEGTTTPSKYDGSAAPAALGGTPPNGKIAITHLSRLLLLAPGGDERSVYFSDALDPESWDTTNAVLRVTEPIKAACSLRNQILVWSDSIMERIVGSAPPPDGDMERQALFAQGCLDHRSVVVLDDKAVFANQNGVWLTDGAGLENLTDLGGIGKYWREIMTDFQGAGFSSIVCDQLGKYLIVHVYNSGYGGGGANELRRTFLCDVENRAWSRMSNFQVGGFAQSTGLDQELYMYYPEYDRLVSLSTILKDTADDGGLSWSADGSDSPGPALEILPVIELPFYRGDPGKMSVKSLILGYVLSEASDLGGATDPEIQIAYVTDPADSDYETLFEDDGVTPIVLDESGSYARERVKLNLEAQGVGLRLTQVDRSIVTKLFDIEAIAHAKEQTK